MLCVKTRLKNSVSKCQPVDGKGEANGGERTAENNSPFNHQQVGILNFPLREIKFVSQ
jgi:hypothetical protein